MKLPIYMDNHATTPVDPRVFEEMKPYFCDIFGNAHSRNHSFGWQAEDAVEKAREHVAKLIHANDKEIVFTSGATESDNLAIKGVAEMYREKGNHIITVQTEHKAVLDTCKYLEKHGYEVTYLPVGNSGLVDLDLFKETIKSTTILISVMFVNNEIGVIQPIEEIGRIAKEKGVLFHCDAAQAIGKVPVDVEKMGIDLMSISAHKMYGPKGIGALYVRRKNPRVRIAPTMHGGGHERGLRSGTLNTPSIVGFGAACEIAMNEMAEESARVFRLREKLRKGITDQISHVYLNGDLERRLPGNLNLSFAFVEGESLLMGIKDIAVSSGSACTSASLEPSYVLKALGVGEELAHTSIRFGIGRFNTEEEIDFTIRSVVSAVNRLRELSPLWEMAQEGIDLKSVQWTGH